MDPEGQQQPQDKKYVPRDERLDRIRRLIVARGEDAAKLVQTWLHADEGKARRRK